MRTSVSPAPPPPFYPAAFTAAFTGRGNVMPLLRFLSEMLTFTFLIGLLYVWAAFGPALRL